MHKKLGPLEAWQWAAILAGLLLIYYEYEKNKANTATTGTTSSTDTSGAIDPTTGIPYADEIGAGAGYGYSGSGGGIGDTGSTGTSTDSGTSLDQELSDLGSIESLMQGLGIGTTVSSSPAGLTPGQQNTLNSDLSTLNKTLTRETKTLGSLGKTIATLRKQVAKLQQPKRETKPANHKNPGHHVTTHVGGSRIASSSAPHNGQQHKNIQPPSHQRATHRPAPKPKPRKKARR